MHWFFDHCFKKINKNLEVFYMRFSKTIFLSSFLIVSTFSSVEASFKLSDVSEGGKGEFTNNIQKRDSITQEFLISSFHSTRQFKREDGSYLTFEVHIPKCEDRKAKISSNTLDKITLSASIITATENDDMSLLIDFINDFAKSNNIELKQVDKKILENLLILQPSDVELYEKIIGIRKQVGSTVDVGKIVGEEICKDALENYKKYLESQNKKIKHAYQVSEENEKIFNLLKTEEKIKFRRKFPLLPGELIFKLYTTPSPVETNMYCNIPSHLEEKTKKRGNNNNGNNTSHKKAKIQNNHDEEKSTAVLKMSDEHIERKMSLFSSLEEFMLDLVSSLQSTSERIIERKELNNNAKSDIYN